MYIHKNVVDYVHTYIHTYIVDIYMYIHKDVAEFVHTQRLDRKCTYTKSS